MFCVFIGNTSTVEVPVSYPPFSILCSRDNWIVIHSRHIGLALSFNRTMQEYTEGFGNLKSEFWLGLEKLHQITSNRYARYTMRFEGRQSTGYDVSTEYLDVKIAGKEESYKLTYQKRGQSTKSYGNLASGAIFRAREEPGNATHSCVVNYNGWWYRNTVCFQYDLNFNANVPFWDRGTFFVQTEISLKPVFA